MDAQITQTTLEYDVAEYPAGITVEAWMDKLDKRLIEHFGNDFRNNVNASRKRWNENGRWDFDML